MGVVALQLTEVSGPGRLAPVPGGLHPLASRRPGQEGWKMGSQAHTTWEGLAGSLGPWPAPDPPVSPWAGLTGAVLGGNG